MIGFSSFLRLNNIPLCIYTIFSLFIHLSKDISCLLQIMLQRTFNSQYLFKISFSILLDKYPKVRLLDHMCAKSFQSCLTLCDPMDCSPPGSSVHGILQARILERVAMPFSRLDWPYGSPTYGSPIFNFFRKLHSVFHSGCNISHSVLRGCTTLHHYDVWEYMFSHSLVNRIFYQSFEFLTI